MRSAIQQLLTSALQTLVDDGFPEVGDADAVQVERARDSAHGDFATSLALRLAKPARMKPRDIAERLVAALPQDARIERVEIAGPGFINFHLSRAAYLGTVLEILETGAAYGRGKGGRRVQVEFVSANPTGPLHVGHGRGAAYGSALASLLEFAGHEVTREYYVNDAGRQIDILALSVWLRALEAEGAQTPFPPNAYQGDYIRDLAGGWRERHAAALAVPHWPQPATAGAQPDAGEADPEQALDRLIACCRETLGETAYASLRQYAADSILEDIRADLEAFRAPFDRWFSERALVDGGAVQRATERLRESGHLYQRDGAWWFRSSQFGDTKDRVVVRDNGEPTYFASDVAYHLEKMERGFDTVIDVWGADHHGYAPRVQAALTALCGDAQRLEVALVQFAVLYRGSEKVSMSTRSGEFVTLAELREEVGTDAARFFFLMRKADQHLDFDLELAKQRSNDNPVYYVQYAHARIASVFSQLQALGKTFEAPADVAGLNVLATPEERGLLMELGRYPELIATAAAAREPHQVVYYLRDLAQALHGYYTAHPFLVDDDALRNARLALLAATRVVLASGLGLLGLDAPERM